MEDGVINYIDEIEFLRIASNDGGWTIQLDLFGNHDDDFRNAVTRQWAINYAIAKCYDEATRDPIEILEQEAIKYKIESTSGKQGLNLMTYNTAYLVVSSMRDMLLQRRNKSE